MDLFAPSHLLILLVIVLVIFGPSKLGDVGGAMGKAIRDFKRAMNDNESQTQVKAVPPEVPNEKPVNPT
jgi:sec-independent protein translocase protein TatA